MVALAAGFILIVLIAVVVTLVDAARSAHWRTVAVRRRLTGLPKIMSTRATESGA
jgi:hypothetical protein